MTPTTTAGARGPAAWSMPRRLLRLVVGQLLFALSMALLLRSDLGAMPWDVLHQGLSRQLGWSIGTVVLVVGGLLLLLWIPLRVRPGIGTLTNVLLIAVAIDAALAVLPHAGSLPVAVAMLVAGVLLNGFATAVYVGARLGPGPRDGLMTGLVARTGLPVRVVRIGIEVSVVAAGWACGGTVGVGTVVFALTIGPVVHQLMPRWAMPDAVVELPPDPAAAPSGVPAPPEVPAPSEVTAPSGAASAPAPVATRRA